MQGQIGNKTGRTNPRRKLSGFGSLIEVVEVVRVVGIAVCSWPLESWQSWIGLFLFSLFWVVERSRRSGRGRGRCWKIFTFLYDLLVSVSLSLLLLMLDDDSWFLVNLVTETTRKLIESGDSFEFNGESVWKMLGIVIVTCFSSNNHQLGGGWKPVLLLLLFLLLSKNIGALYNTYGKTIIILGICVCWYNVSIEREGETEEGRARGMVREREGAREREREGWWERGRKGERESYNHYFYDLIGLSFNFDRISLKYLNRYEMKWWKLH